MANRTPLTVLFLSNRHPSRGRTTDIKADGPDPDQLRNGLARLGIRVRTRTLHSFPINPLARYGTFYAGFDVVRALCVLLFERHVDVVVSVGESNLVVILLLARMFRFKPFIVLREISARGWRRRDLVVDYVVPRVDRVLVLTPHQKQWAQEHFRLQASPDLVGFAIDEKFYKPSGCQDAGYILAVGDDVGRDYACLIAACRGTSHRLMLRTSTKATVPQDMTGQVTVIGRLSALALRDLYDAASVVVVSLHRVDHPSGITGLFEAMSMGCAIVATDVGSTRHLLEGGINGLLVQVGDPAAMRAAITTLMDDRKLRSRLGQNARMTILENHSYARYVERFADSLHGLVAPA